MFDMLIKNGLIVTHEEIFKADIAIKNGKILSIGTLGSLKAVNEIDADGKLVMPGLIDPHVHIGHPFKDKKSQDDFYSATVSAAFGGTTTVIDFGIQWNKQLDLRDTLKKRISEADGQAIVDYALHVCPTDSSPDIVSQVKSIIDCGFPSFKLYMIYRKQGRMVDDAVVFSVMNEAKKYNGIVGVHAENSAIAEYNEEELLRKGLNSAEYFPLMKPNMVEAEAINRVLYLNKWAKGQLYIFHLSTAEGLELIMKQKGEGQDIYAETCPHYLVLNKDVYSSNKGYNYICSPPLRDYQDIEALWDGVANGYISTIGSDHCGFGAELKESGNGTFNQTPNGLPGIELRLPLIYTEGVLKKRISLNKLVEVLSTNPAKIFGLFPRKGAIMPGSDADITIVDINETKKVTAKDLHSTVDWTPYEGMVLTGFAATSILRGEVLVHNGELKGKQGYGKLLERRL